MRAAVVAATLDLIAESGLAALSIADVAARSGVHETSIYRRWRTLDRLVLDTLIACSDELLPTPDTGSLHTDLVALGAAVVEYYRSPPGLAVERTLAVNDDDADTAAGRESFWQARHAALRPVVERAKERGELPATVDGRMLIEVFVAPIHFRLLLTREPVDEPFLRQLAAIAVAGLTAVQPS